MKIIRLSAENVKRLKAVEIEPDGTLQVITGRNAQGKSSVLDAIWLALAGGAASRGMSKPVRDGEESAIVKLDLGELKVTRTWSKSGKSALKVESADGAQYKSPQSMLDGLVGSLSFDPLEFTRKPDREQVEELLGLVDLDIDLAANDAERQRLYDARTLIGSQARAIGEVAVDASLPEVEASAAAIIGELREAQELHRTRSELASDLVIAEKRVEQLRDELANWESTVKERKEALSAMPAELPNIESIENRLSTVEDANAAIRSNNIARERLAQKDALTARYAAHTAAIDELDKAKSAALAKAKFPVDGLGFDESGVTYQNVPFNQASSAEQIRVSLAMAMALNPNLRVVRILDGSLVDSEGMKQIAELAREKDFQIWIERVEDSSESAVVIEDGQVAS